MSRVKDLKNNLENNLNLFDLFSLIVPQGKSKYTETFLRIMKKTSKIEEHISEIKKMLSNELNVESEKLNQIPDLQIIFFYRILDMTFNTSDIKSFQKFCEYNERGLIKQNDLSKYNSFDEIMNSLSIAEMSVQFKDLEKQIKIVYENDEWILVRPLTYFASKKYGSNTKWCTTQENNPEYFNKYSGKGVLIYCINKKNGYKVASFYSLDKNDPEFSFWDQKDKRIDSLESELSDELRHVVFKESKNKTAKTNKFLLSDDERIKEEMLLKSEMQHKYSDSEPVLAEQPFRTERIRRAIERTQESDIAELGEAVDNNNVLERMRLISTNIESENDNYIGPQTETE